MQLLLSKEEHNTVKFKWLSRLPRFNLFHVRTNLLFELISNHLPVFLMLGLSFKHYLSKTGSSTFTKVQPFFHKYYFQAREKKNLGIHSLQKSSCNIFLFSIVAICFDVERQENKIREGLDRRRLLHRPGQPTDLPQRYFEFWYFDVLNLLHLLKYIPETGDTSWGATGAVSALVIVH